MQVQRQLRMGPIEQQAGGNAGDLPVRGGPKSSSYHPTGAAPALDLDRRGCPGQLIKVGRRQRDFDRSQIFVQTVELARAGNGHDPRVLRAAIGWDRMGAADRCGPRFGEAEVLHLAPGNQGTDRARDILDRRGRIDTVLGSP